MKYQVDAWNNFCRVFELPITYPNDFCFGGGHPVNFQMVDWFYPIPEVPQAAISKQAWEREVGPIETKEVDLEELEKTLIPFLMKKVYIKAGRKYLVIYRFGGSSTFDA